MNILRVKASRLLIGTICALPVLLTVTACGTQDSGSAVGTSGTQGASSGGSATEIVITANDNKFEPAEYTAPSGQPLKITLKNAGNNPHTVEIEKLIAETSLAPGQSKSFEIAAQSPGTYELECEIHLDEGMKGTFVVK